MALLISLCMPLSWTSCLSNAGVLRSAPHDVVVLDYLVLSKLTNMSFLNWDFYTRPKLGATSPSSFSKASESEGVPTVTRMHPDKLAWSPR